MCRCSATLMTLLLSLCAFYLSAQAFAVLFILSFLDLPRHNLLQSQRKCEKKTKMEFSLWKHITIIRWRYAAKAMLAKITPRHTSLRPDKSTFAFFIFILTAHKFLKAVNVPVLHKNYDFISICRFCWVPKASPLFFLSLSRLSFHVIIFHRRVCM